MIVDRRVAVHTSLAALATAALAALTPRAGSPAAAKHQKSKKIYPVYVTCLPPSDVCPQEFVKSVKTSRVLEVEFIAHPDHCTEIAISLSVMQNGEFFDGGDHFLIPGESTGVVKFTTNGISPGRLQVHVGNAQDLPGGTCPDGPLLSWQGTLKVKTSKKV